MAGREPPEPRQILPIRWLRIHRRLLRTTADRHVESHLSHGLWHFAIPRSCRVHFDYGDGLPPPFSRSRESVILCMLSLLFTSPCPGTKPLGPDASICKQAESPEALAAAWNLPQHPHVFRTPSSEHMSPATILHWGISARNFFAQLSSKRSNREPQHLSSLNMD